MGKEKLYIEVKKYDASNILLGIGLFVVGLGPFILGVIVGTPTLPAPTYASLLAGGTLVVGLVILVIGIGLMFKKETYQIPVKREQVKTRSG